MCAVVYPTLEVPAPLAFPADYDHREHLQFLESWLSQLMDSKDEPGWRVNPAYHPEVTAFIRTNAYHSIFHRKALALQKNRASYYARTCTRQAQKPTRLGGAKHTTLDTSACYGAGTY